MNHVGEFTYRWRLEVERRLADLEVALEADTQSEVPSPGQSYLGLVSRVTRLESLSRQTLARSCHQLYELGVRSSGDYWVDPDGVGAELDILLQTMRFNSARVAVHLRFCQSLDINKRD